MITQKRIHRAGCRCRLCHPARPGESRLWRALAHLISRWF